MSDKFMSPKQVVIPILSLAISASQLAGCATAKSAEFLNMINNSKEIEIQVSQPSYNIKVLGTVQKSIDWIQLDQLKTYNNGFRQVFDEIFNTNIVTENGVNVKSSCLYVDETGNRNGNTTLEDALRNKVFATKYWSDTVVKQKIAKAATQAYTDVSTDASTAIAGAINAYYNLLPDATNPNAFNGTQSLTREQFYTLVYKTEEGVNENLKSDAEFDKAIGGATEYSKFAQGVDEYGFLSVKNKSLDGVSYKGTISRAEAIYLLVNKHFSKELEKVTGKEDAFSDTKNAGDLAYNAEFKYKDKDTKEIVGKERWQAYTLAYMMKNPDDGMQDELYKAMVVAKNLKLISGDESRWDEPLSKAEAINLIINTHLAKNGLYGYLSKVEYGKLNPTEPKNQTKKVSESSSNKSNVSSSRKPNGTSKSSSSLSTKKSSSSNSKKSSSSSSSSTKKSSSSSSSKSSSTSRSMSSYDEELMRIGRIEGCGEITEATTTEDPDFGLHSAQ